MVDLPRGALDKAEKVVDLPRGALGKAEKMVDLPRAWARTLGKGAICMAKIASFAESPPGGSRQRGFLKKIITLPRALLPALGKDLFQKKN